ncbi:MAG: hypothetical protein ACLQG3_00575 [Terracidiphilus sp.]
MFMRSISAVLAGCTLLIVPVASFAQDRRGPSTSDERRQALDFIHQWQADPLGPQAKDRFGWVLKWFADVPDLTVHVCTILDKLPKGDKKDSNTIFGGEFMGQAEFVLENLDKKDDRMAEYQAGVEGALHVYELLLQKNSKDRQPYLDDLIQRRDAGTLAQLVRERAAAACGK